jgi:hypothetical protein
MDNRFSTMTEVRRVLWPAYETPRFADPLHFQQGIAGALELFFWAWIPFQKLVGEVTGYPPPVFQRVDQAGFFLPLDERVLSDVDTLFVFGLDHDVTGQTPSPEEIEAVRGFLRREGTCLVIGPHHDVGAATTRTKGHGIRPPRRRPGAPPATVRRLCARAAGGLGYPRREPLRPTARGRSRTSKIAPLTVLREADTKGWLEGVENLNFHMHLPHYAITRDDGTVRVLARQPIDLSRPHPFIAAGETEFNALLWAPPAGERAGDVLVCDSTVFSTLFGGDESLERFWTNLALGR